MVEEDEKEEEVVRVWLPGNHAIADFTAIVNISPDRQEAVGNAVRKRYVAKKSRGVG